MSDRIRGSCLCGAVHYTIGGAPQLVGKCYCVDCRKASGTGHCTHVALAEEQVELTGETACFERPADSGNMIARSFCPICGSALFSRNSSMPGMIFVRASSLDDVDAISAAMSVYTSRAPGWDRPDPALPGFVEMPEGGPQAVLPSD